MIIVKFFGMLSVEYNLNQLQVEAGTVGQVFEKLKRIYPEIPEVRLRQSLLFINQEPVTGSRRFSIALRDGDELTFISPVAGG